jgi:hypothetical protein
VRRVASSYGLTIWINNRGRVSDLTGPRDLCGEPLNLDLAVDTENFAVGECVGRAWRALGCTELGRTVQSILGIGKELKPCLQTCNIVESS